MRNFIAILLVILGIVGIASGIWGFSLDAEADVNATLLKGAQAVLNFFSSTVNAINGWVADITDGKVNLANSMSNLIGADLSTEAGVAAYVGAYALRFLLVGVIGVESGLLLFKGKRK